MRTRFVFVILLMFVATVAMAGGKPSLGVAEFTNETTAYWWTTDTARDLSAMLTNELAGVGKFKVVERSKLEKVLDEQDLADSGRISKSTGAKIGKLTGAQYLVFATVSAFEQNSRGTGGGLSFKGISVGGKKEEAYIAVDLRVVDTTTGEISYTRTIEARSSSYGISGGISRGGFSGGLGKYENTPTGKAIRGMVTYIVDYLGCVMVDQDGCEAEYAAAEKSRRDKTKKSIKLD